MRLRSGFDSESTIVKERFFLRRIGGTDLIDSETLSIGKIIPTMVVQAPHRKTKLDQVTLCQSLYLKRAEDFEISLHPPLS
jgi:hypothetical protein